MHVLEWVSSRAKSRVSHDQDLSKMNNYNEFLTLLQVQGYNNARQKIDDNAKNVKERMQALSIKRQRISKKDKSSC